MPSFKKGKLYTIDLSELKADPYQARKTMDEIALAELSASIAKMEVIEPIVFRVDGEGNKVIVAGERRVEAARRAGLTTIPAIFIAGKHAEISLAENLQREDLTPIEEAEGLLALMNEQQYSQEELSAIIGKSQPILSLTLSLNNLPQEVRDDCRGNRTVAKTALVAIAKKKHPQQMIAAYQALKAKLAAVKPSVKRKGPQDPRKVLDLLDKALAKLNATDTSTWSSDDVNTFHTSLTSLKTGIELHLNGSAPPPSA